MDLVADIGNTRCHLAAFDRERIVARAAVRGAQRGEWDAFLAGLPAKPARVAVSSVRPEVKDAFAAWVRERLGLVPLVLGESLRPRIPVDVDRPEQVGSDRLVNALWAARRFPGRAAIVVDFGTAASFAVVSSRGAFVGGAIAPGVGTQARALSERTALLPLVQPTRCPPPIGRDTVACIDSGIFWGVVGLVDLLAEKMEGQLGEKAVVLATGGDAELIASGSRRIDRVVPDLTLEGVHLCLVEAAS